MNRTELKEFLENSEFKYHSKIDGKKSHLRYTLSTYCIFSGKGTMVKSTYIMYLLCTDYNANALSLYCQHYSTNNILHHSNTCFTELHVHNLTKEELKILLDMFIIFKP
jgi:hypothetical protein